MAINKRPRNFDETLRKVGTVVGQFMARSQVKFERTGKKAFKTTQKLLDDITCKSNEAAESSKTSNSETTIYREEGAETMSKPRLRPIKNKPIDESIRILGEDIIEYLTDNGKTTTAEMMMVMEKRRRSPAMIYGAIGWLAAENRIHITRNGQNLSLG